MDIRADNRRAADHKPDPTGGVVDATNRRLSDLDESRAFGEHWTCSRALNASLTLSRGDGTTEDFTDLCSSYGAVNFGHCNEDIRLPAQPRADLVAGIYPPEAEKFARWLTNALDVSDFHHMRINHSELFADRGNHKNLYKQFKQWYLKEKH